VTARLSVNSRFRVSWILFVSRRYFRTRRREKGHTASVLSVAGIAAGVMTLIVVLAVMNGFQLNTIRSILRVNSYHLRVTVHGDHTPDPRIERLLQNVPGVQSVVPFVDVQTVAQGYFSGIQAVTLRGVPTDVLSLDPSLKSSLHMVAGVFDLTHPGGVVLGTELARSLGVRVGDTVSILSVLDGAVAGRKPDFVVEGLFKTGFYDYDMSWGFISLTEAERRFGVSGDLVYGIKLDNRFADQEAAARITALLPSAAGRKVSVESWRVYNRAIFGALSVEKTAMMLLVGLIFIVVGVNIYQSLRRTVYERTEDIGVLKAVGAPPLAIQLIFIFDGFFIGILGALIGTFLGLFLSVNINGVFSAIEIAVNALLAAGGPALQQAVGIRAGEFSIFSPEYFYLSSVPTQVVYGEVFGIFLFAMLSSVVASLLAALRVARIKPAAVLRYE